MQDMQYYEQWEETGDVMFNTPAVAFYRDLKPRGTAKWFWTW